MVWPLAHPQKFLTVVFKVNFKLAILEIYPPKKVILEL